MYKKLLLLVAMLAVAYGAAAQWRVGEADTSRSDVHLSMGTTVLAGYGNSQALGWVAPSVEYRLTDRLTVDAGFAAVGTLLDGYTLHGREPRSLAPVRRGTQMLAFHAGARYEVNERLTLWGSVTRLTGYAQPLWLDGSLPIEATDISGGVAYRMESGSLIEAHFHFIHDHYGTARAGLLGHPYYGPLVPEWDLYYGPWPF